MRNFKQIMFALLALVFITTTSQAQVLDPNDPIVEYNPSNPPSLPSNGTIKKWVRTDRLNWDADSYKAYIFRGAEILPFRLKFPSNYNPQDSKVYPIIVMLHGKGEAANFYDNEISLKHGGDIHRKAVDNGQFDGFVLFPQSVGAWSPDYLRAVSQLLDKLVTDAKVDPFRVSVHGLSNGAKGVWTFLMDYTKQVASALPMSGTTSDRTDENLNRIKYTPVWNSQGGLDTNPTPSGSRYLADQIWDIGGNMRYTLYPELGHGVWNTHYKESDFFPFMMRANKVNPWPLFEKTEFCPGDNINVKLGVTPGFNGYEWRKNGTVIAGASSNQLTVTAIGTYDVRINRNGTWSYWSPVPVIIKIKDPTQTPPIQLAAAHSKVVPSPDGRDYTILELPEGFVEYSWKKVGSNTVIGTNRFLSVSDPGDYVATVKEKFGCSSNPSAPFKVVDASGANGPDPAVGVVATTLSKTDVKVAWSDNPNAANQETGFEVYRAQQAGGPYSFIHLTGANVFSYTDANLTPGTSYYYIIRSVNNNAASAVSNEALAKTKSDTDAPTAPLKLAILSATDNSVDLVWEPSTDDVGVEKYLVYRNGRESAGNHRN